MWHNSFLGVTSILHLASPVSFAFSDPEPVIHAAVNGTKAILDSALKAGPELKNFVLLSSIVSVMNGKPAPYTLTEKDWNNWAEAKVAELGKNTPGPIIYSASKVAAEKAFWKFREERNPKFAMTALNPV
jgi:nucleoside-diphosphate-sugar epimerase